MSLPIIPCTPEDQIDPAVELGLVPEPLPEIESLESLVLNPPTTPPELIAGILHQGSKLILGGTSKSNKSWALLDMAVSVATGTPWWGFATFQRPVLYLNMELARWAITSRLNAIAGALGGSISGRGLGTNLHLWNLRGRAQDITLLRPQLEAALEDRDYGLIILDPAYKLLGDRDENANGEIAGMMNELERLACRTKSSIVIAHHFAKGNATDKSPIDRMSGAGAWARDPDSLIVLTPHEEEDCFVASFILRNHARQPDIALRWSYPRTIPDDSLNPEALKRPQSSNKVASDAQFLSLFSPAIPVSMDEIVEIADTKLGMSRSTTYRNVKRLCTNNLLRKNQDGTIVK